MNGYLQSEAWMRILENSPAALDEQNAALLQSIFKPRVFKRDMFFLHAGEESTEIGVVASGTFRSFYNNLAGNDITKYFYTEGGVLLSYFAYLKKRESMYSIQALEDSEIFVTKISDFAKITEGNYQLLLLCKKVMDCILIMKEEHASSFTLLNSTQRYQKFLADYPGLEERIKQHQLASYLGITPVSLSRIRKRLNLNK